jgi:hypothetical protein
MDFMLQRPGAQAEVNIQSLLQDKKSAVIFVRHLG